MVRGFLLIFLKNFFSEKKNSIFAVQFINNFFVVYDIEKRANWHKDILE